MDFLGMGMGEILLILVVALILMGPAKVINVAKRLGQTVQNIKKAVSEISTQVNQEVNQQKNDISTMSSQVVRDINEQSKSITDLANGIKDEIRDVNSESAKSRKPTSGSK
jgi:sec-independent protein translocase protein TatA